MDRSRFEYSFFTGGDSEPLVRLIRGSLVGGSYMDSKWFDWKHFQNPNGPSIIIYATDRQTGQIAAMRALWAWKLRCGQAQIDAYQPCESLTAPDYQRMGLFTRLTRMAVDLAGQKHARFLFNFPNANSKPAYIKMGWHCLGGLATLWKPAGPVEIIASLFQRKPDDCSRSGPDDSAIASADKYDSRKEDISGHHRLKGSMYFGSRHQALIDWRLKRPGGLNRLVRTDKAAAIVHLRHRGKLREACIIELLQDNAQLSDIKVLLRAIQKQLKPTILTTILTPSHPDVAIYKSLGFRFRSNQTNFVAAAVEMDLPVPASADWALSGFDIDTF